MKRIILQHMTGDLRELDKLSIENIKKYAEFVNADYRLLRGNVFDEKYRPPIQKIYMLNEEFDEYDDLLMLDIDMFAVKGMSDDVFEEPGIGLYSDIQQRLHKRLANAHPKLVSIKYPYWGGAIYKLSREHRQILRKGLEGDTSWINTFQKGHYFGDEGIMAVLATRAKFKIDSPYLKDNKWCYCSYLPNPSDAGFIHVRTKIKPAPSPKRKKIENYQELKKQGIIE